MRRNILLRVVGIMLVVAILAVMALVIWPVSPTIAVLSQIVLEPLGSGLPSSFHVWQSMPVDQGLIVYYTFEQADRQGVLGECSFVSYVRRRAIGWQSAESYGGCQPHAVDSDSLTAVSRNWILPEEDVWSEVHGAAADPSVHSLHITWSDGMTYTAILSDGHYLAIRPGHADVVQVEMLDSAGITIDTQEQATMP